MGLENTLDNLDGLSERRAALYTKDDASGKFELDEAYRQEDNTALLSAKRHEAEARKLAEKKAKDLIAEKAEWEIKKAELEGNKEKADKLRQDALDKQKADHQNELATAKQAIHDLTIGKLKGDIANQVYLKPERMDLSHIESRIKLGDNNAVSIVDQYGATMSTEDFVAELKADKDMAIFMKAGGGKGGGGGGDGGAGGGGAGGAGDLDPKAAAIAKKKAALKAKYPKLRSA